MTQLKIRAIPWAQYATGNPFELRHGTHYTTPTAHAIQAARSWGTRNGYRVSIGYRDDERFTIAITDAVKMSARQPVAECKHRWSWSRRTVTGGQLWHHYQCADCRSRLMEPEPPRNAA